MIFYFRAGEVSLTLPLSLEASLGVSFLSLLSGLASSQFLASGEVGAGLLAKRD